MPDVQAAIFVYRKRFFSSCRRKSAYCIDRRTDGTVVRTVGTGLTAHRLMGWSGQVLDTKTDRLTDQLSD